MKIGVVVRTGPISETEGPAPYQFIRQMALQLEHAGLDSIWLYDHLLYRWPGKPTDGIWECWTMLTALAEATQRVELGTMVLCTQFRNPALLAKMAVTLDEICGGRLILGLGAGWHKPEFDAFGFPFDHRASRFAEAVGIIKPLLREGRVNNCEMIPRGPREQGPPLLLAGKGPRMMELIARHADAWNTAWHADPATVRPELDRLHAACDRVKRDPRTIEVTAAVSVAYPDLGSGGGRQSGSLSGDATAMADALHGYEELGVSHVIVELVPFTRAAVDRFAEAVERFR